MTDKENEKRKRGPEYPDSADDGKTPLGEAGDTLEKFVADIPNVGQWPTSREKDAEKLEDADDEVERAEGETKAAEEELRRKKEAEER